MKEVLICRGPEHAMALWVSAERLCEIGWTTGHDPRVRLHGKTQCHPGKTKGHASHVTRDRVEDTFQGVMACGVEDECMSLTWSENGNSPFAEINLDLVQLDVGLLRTKLKLSPAQTEQQ